MRSNKWIWLVPFGFLVVGFVMLDIPTFFKVKESSHITSESKVCLSQIYAIEQAFYVENGEYSSDLKGLGFPPEPLGYVKCGFLTPTTTLTIGDFKLNPALKDTDELLKSGFYKTNPYKTPELKNFNFADLAKYCPDCGAKEQSFKAISVGVFPNGELDIWTIDQNKKLVHLKDGRKKK